MSRRWLGVALASSLLFASTQTQAVDHNRVESGRPLGFDDASVIGRGERSLEFGLRGGWRRDGSASARPEVELGYGFARNLAAHVSAHLSIGPTLENNDGGTELEEFTLTLAHHLRRQTLNGPALAYRVDVAVPTRAESSVRTRLRGILSRSLRQYDTLHLNADLVVRPGASALQREVSVAAALGYSVPIGFPRRFDRSFLAAFTTEQSEIEGQGWRGAFGVGLRQQVGFRSVVDVGVESDLFVPREGANHELRVNAGYSVGF